MTAVKLTSYRILSLELIGRRKKGTCLHLLLDRIPAVPSRVFAHPIISSKSSDIPTESTVDITSS